MVLSFTKVPNIEPTFQSTPYSTIKSKLKASGFAQNHLPAYQSLIPCLRSLKTVSLIYVKFKSCSINPGRYLYANFYTIIIRSSAVLLSASIKSVVTKSVNERDLSLRRNHTLSYIFDKHL